jgi:hypothetical protein
MVKLDLNEIVYIHQAISELDIKGAQAPFVTNILTKLATEANEIQESSKEVSKSKK